MSAEKKPVVAITIGDPAGIGPEITVATMMDKSVYDECKPFLIGSVPIISRAMKIMGCDFAIHKIAIRRRPVLAGGRWMFWKLATTIATVSNGARCRNWRGKCRWTM
ncbi:4-hydroxythreonine-4-phosphate dehydrogenase [Klebsiella pneumoniae subsp. pneumoniae]|uniref:4-hydroxythreonine-4-phosphate dehydrogenase n=1 Tax=Klebsiella pneumoniae subsp. pneumoniae TaxID=72407 RepID=A0A377ZZA6_KLEPN|nr:4-hydroxythreonine-4-phosphate dehydrogenase [Klebsiella pneumoniae subsp. pneumoniae]